MYLKDIFFKNSKIFLSKYYTKTIKKWLPKNLPFFSTLRRISGEQFYAFKVLWVIAPT
jgi:hypothetical protein